MRLCALGFMEVYGFTGVGVSGLGVQGFRGVGV